jgi:hypothetical protein
MSNAVEAVLARRIGTTMPDTPSVTPKRKINLPPWAFATRGLGVVMVLYALLVDHTPERGMILLTGAGFVGLDKVARSEGK